MEYVALVCAILAGVASTVAAIFWAENKVKVGLIQEQKKLLDAAAKEKAKMQADLDDAVSRREKIILDLKANLATAEEDLAKASTPAAVRDRLSKLFP